MKKIILSFLIIILTCLSVSLPVKAQYGLQETVSQTPYPASTDVPSIIEKVISGALGFLAIVFFGLAFYAGMRWMTARGDEGFVDKAKDTLRAAVMGLVITLAAYALTKFVFELLNNKSSPPTAWHQSHIG